MAYFDFPAYACERTLAVSPAVARVPANATITIAGTNAATDVSQVTFANAAFTTAFGGNLVVTSRALAGQTTAAAEAAQIAADINAHAGCMRAGIYAKVAAAVITVYQPGPVGNLTTITFTASAGSQTGTVSNAGVMSGGSGPAVVLSAGTFTPPSTNVPQSFTERELYIPAVATDLSSLLSGGMVAL